MSDSASVKARLGPAFFGHLPHWATARAVASKPAAELTAAEFKKQAVPLLIKGATEGWPAAERWKDPGYLVQSAGSSLVTIRDIGADVDANRRVSLAEYLELLEQPDGVYMGPTPNRIPGELTADIRPFPFLPGLDPWTIWFVGKGSYTGCHHHYGSGDVLMCQVLGTKTVCLYAPNWRNDRALYAARKYQNWSPVDLVEVDWSAFPRFAESQPWSATVEQGDALFIPDYWWHAVASTENAYGITVAHFFESTGLNLLAPPVLRRLYDKIQHGLLRRVRERGSALGRSLER
jgi:hypothetical protein